MLIVFAGALQASLIAAGGTVAPPPPWSTVSAPTNTLDMSRLNATISRFTTTSMALLSEAQSTAAIMNEKRVKGTLSEVYLFVTRVHAHTHTAAVASC